MTMNLQTHSVSSLSDELWTVNEVFDSDELFQEDCNIELEKVNMSNVFEAGVQDFCEYQLMSLEDYNKKLATKMVWEPIVDEKEPMVELTLIECPIPPKLQTPNTPDSGVHHQLWSPPSSSGTSDEDTDYYPIVHIQRKNRKSKTPKENRRHGCNLCDKKFVRPAELKRHLTTHTNERCYKCEICSTSFKRADHYRSHYKSVHSEKKLQCGMCDYKTARKDTLNRHIACRHRKVKQ